MLDSAKVTLSDVQMINGKAIGGDGGAIYAKTSGVDVFAELIFLSCNNLMEYFEATSGNGGFFYLNNPLFKLTSAGCGWQHIYAQLQGGLIYGG